MLFRSEKDLVPRRTFGGATKELGLKNPYWKVEEGQVIAPGGHPVVGDYDLLGVLPEESPGRNIVAVPDHHLKGDWTGPDVQKYANAVNRKFDQPRVLHGGQDGFHNQQYGGFTDGAAYAVWGDGSIYVMEGKAEQAAFFDFFKRQTAIGKYPRPSPSTLVPDEFAAIRARRAGKPAKK